MEQTCKNLTRMDKVKELMRLNDENTGAAPSRQIEIRAEILNTGLPGDPIVRRMWAFRDAAAVAVKSTP